MAQKSKGKKRSKRGKGGRRRGTPGSLPDASGRRLLPAASGRPAEEPSQVRVDDVTRPPRGDREKEDRVSSCKRLFYLGYSPRYDYDGKYEDVARVAEALVTDGSLGRSYCLWISRWLWRARGISLGEHTGADPSRSRAKELSVEQGTDALLFAWESRLALRRERKRGRPVASLPKQVLEGIFGETYPAWMRALASAGVLEVVTEYRHIPWAPSGRGSCRSYGLNRRPRSDHSGAYPNPFTASQSRSAGGKELGPPVHPFLERCVRRAVEQARFPDLRSTKDPKQKALLRRLRREPEEALAPRTDLFGQRHHSALTSLKKELRGKITFAGHWTVAIDLKGCYPRVLASERFWGAMNAYLPEGRKVHPVPPDYELHYRTLGAGLKGNDPYEPLARERGSRDHAKDVFSIALHAVPGEDRSALDLLAKAYPLTAEAIGRVKREAGHLNFIRELQAVEQRWMLALLGGCEDAGAPALVVYDEVLVPEWAAPDAIFSANVKELTFSLGGNAPRAEEGGRYLPTWFPEDMRFDPS